MIVWKTVDKFPRPEAGNEEDIVIEVTNELLPHDRVAKNRIGSGFAHQIIIDLKH
jgi:hypothetical protein